MKQRHTLWGKRSVNHSVSMRLRWCSHGTYRQRGFFQKSVSIWTYLIIFGLKLRLIQLWHCPRLPAATNRVSRRSDTNVNTANYTSQRYTMATQYVN